MAKKSQILISVSVVLWITSSLYSTLSAQITVVDGVYTEEQAERGKMLFVETCAECHGEDLQGMEGFIPPLTGENFLIVWEGRSVGDLFDQISKNMPSLNPGSLTPEQAADLAAYILSISTYPAGATELAANFEVLQEIRIDAPNN